MEELEGTNTAEELADANSDPEAPTEAAELSNGNPDTSPYLKIVVNLKGNRAVVSVQQEGTDPVIKVVTIVNQGDRLQEALASVEDLVERARERWATSPRNPHYDAPPPPPRPATTPTPARKGTSPRTAPQPDTNRLF